MSLFTEEEFCVQLQPKLGIKRTEISNTIKGDRNPSLFLTRKNGKQKVQSERNSAQTHGVKYSEKGTLREAVSSISSPE